MRLDRNINPDGRGKYYLLNRRTGKVEYGDTPETEFFVIKLKDKYAYDALRAYALAACIDDPEWSAEVMDLAQKALVHPLRKKPD